MDINGYTQWPIAIEFVLNRGRMVLFDSYQGLTPAIYVIYVLMRISIARLKSKSHILFVYQQLVRLSASAFTVTLPQNHSCRYWLKVVWSKGKDVTAGGAMVNHGPGLIFSGLATYVDSMAAIRKLVYEDKNIP